MSQCPRCTSGRAYRLADGRRKCRRCGRRYAWTSAWDSIRLPARTKRRLLQLFVIGVPAYRLRREGGASLKARERFNRLLRALCAMEEGIDEAFRAALGAGPATPTVEFALALREGRVAVLPPPQNAATTGTARVRFPLRAGRVICTAAEVE